MTVGERIKYLREQKELTQKDVADKLGLEPAAISKYELDMREPNIEAIKTLSEIFNVSVDYLLGRTPDIFVGEKDKIEVNILPIKEKYSDSKEIYINDMAPAIIVNELMCSVGESSYGKVSINTSISFKYISELLKDFKKSELPRPQVMVEIKNKPEDIIIVEIDFFDDEEMSLKATDRASLYTAKLSEQYNVLALAISIDKNENCKLLYSIYQVKGETKYIPLKDLPQTVLTLGEYIDVMSRI